MDLATSAAVVTGGASGLGAATTAMLLEAGGAVAVLDRRGSLDTAVRPEHRHRAVFIELDVTDPAAVERAVDAAAERFGRLDVLVSSAGVSPIAPVLDARGAMAPLEQFRRAFDVNVIGMFDVVRHCARHFAANEPNEDGERGAIVNVASIAAFEGPAGQTAYSASKGAVAALTLPLARDLATWGIRVMAVAPGMMATPMVTTAPDERLRRLRELPLFPRRLGRPDEVASLIRTFLESPMLNGEVVRLDAGARLPADAVLAADE
jgi:NAD(P)-dependent dehydrogenase (short-subunit alcohol dehydrogenase family)